MKTKISFTLSSDILKLMDQLAGTHKNRSEFIEQALIEHLQGRQKRFQDEKDLDILNRKSKRLNQEAHDVLSYQVDL